VHFSRVVVAVAVGLAGALVVPAAPASAHAVLTSATPAQGSIVAAVPDEIRLTFSEPVRVVPGRTQVIAPDGKRISDGDPVGAGARLRITLRPAGPAQGTYLVSYRVISADSHPIGGSFTFSVGAPSAAAPRPARDGAHPGVAVAVPTAKYLGYAGIVLVVGPLLMLLWLWPGRLGRRGPLRLVWTGLGLIAAGALAALWLQAPYSSGAAPFDVTGAELGRVLGDRFGVAMLVRLAVVAAVAYVVWRAHRRGALRRPATWRTVAPLAVLGAVGLATWPMSGHPAASPLPPVSAVADAVHLASMAVWLGGLVMLLGLLLRRADRRELRLILPAWSRWATLAVYWLVAAGVTQALIEVGGPRELVGTAYGRLVLVKVGLLAAVLAVAAYSRRLARAAGSAPARPAGRLRRSVAAEVAVAAVVLVASAALVQTTPGRAAGVEAAAAAQAEGFAETLTSPLYSVQVEIFPAQVGPYNTLHAFLYAPDGRPLAPAEWTVTGALPGAGIEPIDNPVVTIRGNQGIGPVNFPVPGRWRLRLTIRVSETEQATVTATVPVG
jgi:copper transport protein